MAYDLASLQCKKTLRPPRIVLLGVEKIGKSTFAAGAPNPVFLPVVGEEGLDDLDVLSWEPVEAFGQVREALHALYDGKHDYKTIVIDSATTLEPILWNHTRLRCPTKEGTVPDSIEKVHGGYSKGYMEALIEWNELLCSLDTLRSQRGMAVIIIGHVQVRRFDDPTGLSYDQYQFDLNAKAANKLFRWADSILFCNTKVAVKKEDVGFNKAKQKGVDIDAGERFVYTQKRASHPGGGRGVYGRLPYELPLKWAAFEGAISRTIAEEK